MSSRSTEKRRAVPKFASFKPKAAAAELESESKPKAEPREQQEGKEGKETAPQRQHHRHDEHTERESARGKHHRRRRHEPERCSPDPDRKPRHGENEAPRDEPRAAAPESRSNVFFFDKRGDPLILRYGSNDRNKIPSYHRFGAGRLMGANGILTIHHDSARPEFSIRTRHRDTGSIFRDKKAISAITATSRDRPDTHLGPSRLAISQPITLDDFIPLTSSRKRKRGEEEPSSLPLPDYRSIYGKSGNDESDSGSDSEDASPHDPIIDPETTMTTAKKNSIQLSRQVKANPENIASWLQLIDLQDALFRENQTTPSNPTAEEAKGLSALKVSLYEEALPHATQPSDKERLLLGLMREGARAWDPKTLAKRWEEVNRSHGDSFLLWRERLNSELSRTPACSYENLKTFIAERLGLLKGCLREGNQDVDELCSQLVYVFLRLTRFLADAGYTELATAAWQAELETIFCRPAALSEAGEEHALSLFSDFWESEVPRMGEGGAKGWQQFEDTGGMADAPEPKPARPHQSPNTRDKFKAWAAVESQKADGSYVPARTLDEGTEDDPFRVVMFSDIKEFLVWFPAAALSRVGPQLLDAFLLFCGLPTAWLLFGAIDEARVDPFVAGQSEAFEDDLSGKTPEVPEEGKKTPQFRHQGGGIAISQDVLFAGDAWFHYLGNWHRMGRSDIQTSWILGTLKQLVKGCGQEQLAEYYLAAAWRNEPDSARKVAKGLLKQYSSDLRLYSAYALIESANGNVAISEKVLSAATSQELAAPTSAQILFNTWTWIYLKANQKKTALNRLCLSVDRNLRDSPPPPALLLKARAQFSSTRDYALSSHDLETAIRHAESLSLLEYLATEDATSPQGNLTAALTTITTFTTDLATRSLASSALHECLLQTTSHLLYHHITHGPHHPSTIRTHLHHLLHLFPQNTLLLSLFASLQPLLRIDDPVRAALRQHHPLSLPAARFAIAHEARTGTSHSTRSAFEDALAIASIPDTWIRYVRFCASRKELRSLAKGVFYRAIGACPMAKGIYMEGFGSALARDMSSAELRGVFETMVNRGVRVHVDLEGWLGEWDRRKETEREKKEGAGERRREVERGGRSR
ncbi:NRDE-2, necessary for RNA interference-domain-containing protein [Cercophora newfieldiana]|uniref:NRDE-2, necessary for RNA interference-domain-containing protein n=1 Tax=Cercophora newfieldiana TaxID=92897 RepID=A0AA39Y5N9_9PEZI|nr:NRDE-2, necessary for RNA interference-domain-containing protein [Cercophora newfieldiana]